MKKPQARSEMSYYCMVSLLAGLVCMVLGYSIPASASVIGGYRGQRPFFAPLTSYKGERLWIS